MVRTEALQNGRSDTAKGDSVRCWKVTHKRSTLARSPHRQVPRVAARCFCVLGIKSNHIERSAVGICDSYHASSYEDLRREFKAEIDIDA